MFDLEKARKRGLSEKQIKIMADINSNNERLDQCKGHDFDIVKKPIGYKYVCRYCKGEVDADFVRGYMQGKMHGMKAVNSCMKEKLIPE